MEVGIFIRMIGGGRGRETAKTYLSERPEVMKEVEGTVRGGWFREGKGIEIEMDEV